MRLSGHYPALLVVHEERSGVIANVSNAIASQGMNIAHMEVGRKEKGEMALMVIEVDQMIDDDTDQRVTIDCHMLRKFQH